MENQNSGSRSTFFKKTFDVTKRAMKHSSSYLKGAVAGLALATIFTGCGRNELYPYWPVITASPAGGGTYSLDGGADAKADKQPDTQKPDAGADATADSKPDTTPDTLPDLQPDTLPFQCPDHRQPQVTIWTGGEGYSTTFSGMTVKITSIDETVSCTDGGQPIVSDEKTSGSLDVLSSTLYWMSAKEGQVANLGPLISVKINSIVQTVSCQGGNPTVSDEKATLEISVCEPSTSYTFTSLLGDYLDRDLLDRAKGAQIYPMGSYTDPNANPFTDGTGTGNLGVPEIRMHRIDGTMFPPLTTVTRADPETGNTYIEQQDIWMRGHTAYIIPQVVANMNWVAYTLKFSGASDDLGIPVCTRPTNVTQYATCYSGDRTATHRMTVKFLGEDWVISAMAPPAASEKPLTSESKLVSGGSIHLAKEAIFGTLNQGEALIVDGLKFRLDDVADDQSAFVSVLDPNDIVLKQRIYFGTTKLFSVNGTSYLCHSYDAVKGSTTMFAKLAIFSKEMKLLHGYPLDVDNGTNPSLHVYLGWGNKGASATDTQADHLRTVILHSYDIDRLSSGGSMNLQVGDYIPIALNPTAWQLQYKGLTDAKPSNLQFDLERNSPYAISATNGPQDSNGQRVSCTISAPYVRVTSSASGSVFTVDGVQGALGTTSASGNAFYVATNGATCTGSIGSLTKGALLMRASPSSDYWAYKNNSSLSVKYPLAGDGVTDASGIVSYSYVGGGTSPADFEFSISEEAGVGVSKNSPDFMHFGLKLAGASSTFNFDSSVPLYRKNTVGYIGAGPFNSPSLIPVSSGFITERGSQFVWITDTTVTFMIAGQLVYAQFFLTTKN